MPPPPLDSALILHPWWVNHEFQQRYTLALQLRMMSSGAATKKKREFNPNTLLATIGEGRKSVTVSKKNRIFTQGDPADAVFYIQKAGSS
jgi:hypothetical protein